MNGRIRPVTTKPRLYRAYGVWECIGLKLRAFRFPVLRVGNGYTPQAAYNEWKAQPYDR